MQYQLGKRYVLHDIGDYMPENIVKAFNNLKDEVERDTFNLTQDDHSAILVKMNELKDFIMKTYEQRRKLSGLSE